VGKPGLRQLEDAENDSRDLKEDISRLNANNREYKAPVKKEVKFLRGP
jgi:flagellar motility protein MotE (MotC chaperone)